jgi:outer membrane protein assembly factor BamB
LEPIKLTEEILAKHWVSFRNFDGNGIGFSEKPPIKWNGKTGENIVWKSEVPLPGNSSPVIWEDKLFLTGADIETQKIFCYDIKGGSLLWEADVTRPEAKLTEEIDDDTGYAAPTPVVDGRHVYAMFANGELVAVDFSGKFVWRHSFGIPDNHYGFASSPALYFDKLIVQFDDGDGSEGNSKIIAFGLNTGDVLWETSRDDVSSSWASPTIKKIGDSYQIITCANPFVIAYNPEDGKELWRCKCLNGDVGPSAAARGNAVMITNDAPRTTVIDATGSGDITATHILWVGLGSTPDTPSPVIADDYFLMLDSHGFLTGYDPKVINPANKRARYWELEVGDMSNFYSSPLRVGTFLYLFDKTEKDAKAFVIDLSKVAVAEDGTLTEESVAAMTVSENPMPEPCVASPAMLNNRLYIRDAGTIYCIGDIRAEP